jgi:TRAP-type mannitol/chloroaromatic compound transport system permease large subunit
LNSDSLTPGKTITGEVAFSIIEKGVIGVPVKLEYRHENRRMSIGFPKYMI